PACLSVLGTNPAVVVPAQAGTHSHQCLGYRMALPHRLAAAYGSPPARGRQRRVIAPHLCSALAAAGPLAAIARHDLRHLAALLDLREAVDNGALQGQVALPQTKHD